MSIINTGYIGIPLHEIITQLGNKSYAQIIFRCKWTEDGEDFDELFGSCSYDAETQILTPLDGDSYSLNDLYVKWKETNNGNVLTVWEQGVVNEEPFC